MRRIFGVEFPDYQEDVNIIGNNLGSQQQRQGWNQQQLLTYQGKYPGNYYNSSNSVYTKIWKESRRDSKSSQDHVIEETIACRSETTDSNAKN